MGFNSGFKGLIYIFFKSWLLLAAWRGRGSGTKNDISAIYFRIKTDVL